MNLLDPNKPIETPPIHWNCRCLLYDSPDKNKSVDYNKMQAVVENYINEKKHFPRLLKGRSSGVRVFANYRNRIFTIDDFQYTVMLLFTSFKEREKRN